MSEAQLEELRDWHQKVWDRWTTGTPASGAAGFTFTSAPMNAETFNPLRGARGVLREVGALGASKCDDVLTGSGGGCGVTVTCRMLGFFKDRKLETDAYQNPAGTLEHLELILSATGTYNVSFMLNGTTLVSTGLPPVWLRRAVPQPGVLATSVSTPTSGAITALINAAPGLAAGAGNVTEAKKALTGLPSRADNVLNGVFSILEARADLPFFWAYRLNVIYGVFGELPIVVVAFEDGFVLIDGWTGSVVGPFVLSSPLDASGLLARVGLSGQGALEVTFLTESGCRNDGIAGWSPVSPCPPPPPPGSPPAAPCPVKIPPGPFPGVVLPTKPPGCGPGNALPCTPPPYDPSVPGHTPSPDQGCRQSGSKCVCTTYSIVSVPPAGTLYHMADVCICTSLDPAVDCNASGPCTLHCTTYYWYPGAPGGPGGINNQ